VNPFLSVILAVHNGENFVAATLESVRMQHNDEIEVVFVDDASTDRTLEIARNFAESFPMRIITPGRNVGVAAATNIGLREARGEWACLLDHDDLWLPGRIARLWGEMKSTKCALVLHNAMIINPDGQRLGPWTCPLSEGDVPPDQFIERLLVQNFIAKLSPVFRLRDALDTGGVDESIIVCYDWDFWLRLGSLGPVRFIAETLSAYRVHPTSLTVSRKLAPNEWEQQLTIVLDRHLSKWTGTGKRRASVERAARASITVNSSLIAATRGEPAKPLAVFLQLLSLGPAGWRLYLRDSRIVQRLSPRLKLLRSKTS
jgi:GT2 family glycosyltransferase